MLPAPSLHAANVAQCMPAPYRPPCTHPPTLHLTTHPAGGGRILLDSTTSDPSFKWAMIAIGATVAAAVLGVAVFFVWRKMDRGRASASVMPEPPQVSLSADSF